MVYRMTSTVQGRITDGTLFPNISFMLSNAVVDLLDRSEKRLSRIVDETIVALRADLDMTFSSQKTQAESQRNPISPEAKESIVAAMQALEGRYDNLLRDVSLVETE